MKRKLTFSLVCVLAVLVAPAAFAQLTNFTGTWINTDAHTGGITKLVITASPTPADDPHLTVHAWGKCVPADCDWGAVLAHAYCLNISCNMVRTARAITAVFPTDFCETTLVIERARDLLRVQWFTRFTDSTDRRNFNGVSTFKHRLIPVPVFEAPYKPEKPPKLHE